MERVKRRLKRICVLPPLPTVLIALPAFLLVAYVLAVGEHGPLAHLSYAASAYALVISLTGGWRLATSLRRMVRAHPLGGRLVGDPKFRAKISLHQGFLINLSYIAVKLAFGIRYRSPWFISLAAYYALLALMRLLLLFHRKRLDYLGELRRYRLCGFVLLMMNLALAGIVDFMVRQNRGYEYPGTLIYLMAATVSILSLETAMLSRFGGGEGPLFRKRMTGATGGAVCALVLGVAAFMIARSTKHIRRLEIQHH